MLKKRFIAALCAVSMFTGSAYAANIADFPDAAGHWAYDALSNAVDDGYLNGSDGKLNPNASLTAAQMAVILNRVLHTSDTSRVYPNISQSEWYSNDANMAVSAGFLPVDGSLNINNSVTRGEVFKALVNAFGLAEADPSIESVKKFNDWDKMTLDQRRAAAVLIDKGILNGSDNGGLNPNNSISRAEFMTLLYRILDSGLVKIHASWNEEQTEETAEQVAPVLMFADSTYTLSEDTVYNTVVLSGKVPEIPQDYENKIEMARLVINTTGSDVMLDNNTSLNADTIVIGSGNGAVTLNGEITKKVEITGSGRTINLNGVNLDNLVISGINNTIVIDSVSSIQNMTVQVCATNNIITVDGSVTNANVNANYTKVTGNGKITNTVLKGSHCEIAEISESFDDSGVDNGLEGVQISLNTPKVPAGGQLVGFKITRA